MNKGFSLLELLIVVAIILIISIMAVPSLMRSRQSANETASVANLRLINGAQITYVSTHGVYGNLTDLSSAGLVDDRFSADGARVGGYHYFVYGSGTADYELSSMARGGHARYNFYSEADAVIRFRDATAGETLPLGVSPGDPVPF